MAPIHGERDTQLQISECLAMKLDFFKAVPGNFGDDLNAWLWPQLFPGLLGGEDDRRLIGIGSILDARYSMLPGKKIVFGSGARMSATAPKLDSSWDVRFVRGPLTAAALDLKPSAAITDGAAALGILGLERSCSPDGVGFMPHYRTLEVGDWQKICDRARVQFIDPTQPVAEVLHAIGKVDRLVTEALHGAIVADLLRVPWLRVCCLGMRYEGAEVSEFKWLDWSRSLGVSAQAEPFVTVSHARRSWIKQAVIYPMRAWSRARFAPALRRLTHSTRFQLSKQSDLERAIGRIDAHVRQLRSELAIHASFSST
jgi:succinoglycan biosynthesis protein ExoV